MTLPAGMQVFERGWLSSNNVLFAGPDENVLVDTGYVAHAGQTLALVQQALGGAPLGRILNTHLHSDHCGGNAILQAAYPAVRTAIPPGQAEAVRAWDEAALSYAATGQRCDRFAFDAVLAPGSIERLGGLEWELRAAPGHDPHAVMLHCRSERILLSADALWEDGFGVIFPELAGEPGFAEQRAVLREIERLDAALVVPGHGRPFTDLAGALARAHARLDHFEADPARHARHALKVLVVFFLMERRRVAAAELERHFGATAYLRLLAQRHAGGDGHALMQDATDRLARAGVVKQEGDFFLLA